MKTSCAKGDRQSAMSPVQSRGSEALGAPLLSLVGSPSKGDSSGAYRAQLRLKSLVALSPLVHVYLYYPSQCSGQNRREMDFVSNIGWSPYPYINLLMKETTTREILWDLAFGC